ncbi:MAG: hypothetical protein PHQ86_01315 [Dehalococcoidales bacterium]|nr:hypothetical protein [Dehalococcoidales bacterium]
MRDFNDTDRKKKSTRIRIPENPGNLSPEIITQLEGTVKAALKDGYLSCPIAWKIARNANVPKIAVGAIADKLGVRVTNCQVGCFAVEKTPYDKSVHQNIDGEIITILDTLKENKQLTCHKIFELAQQFKLTPMVIADEANIRGLKISSCQLGCF